MPTLRFVPLFQEAEGHQHQDYWIAGAILEFTESVVQEMARQGLTRTALAERLGATPAYSTKILRGRVNFTLATWSPGRGLYDQIVRMETVAVAWQPLLSVTVTV